MIRIGAGEIEEEKKSGTRGDGAEILLFASGVGLSGCIGARGTWVGVGVPRDVAVRRRCGLSPCCYTIHRSLLEYGLFLPLPREGVALCLVDALPCPPSMAVLLALGTPVTGPSQDT